MDRVVVRRGGNCELEYEVDVEESVLKWEFVSTSHDVSYCWFFRHTSVDKKPKDKEVVGKSKLFVLIILCSIALAQVA